MVAPELQLAIAALLMIVTQILTWWLTQRKAEKLGKVVEGNQERMIEMQSVMDQTRILVNGNTKAMMEERVIMADKLAAKKDATYADVVVAEGAQRSLDIHNKADEVANKIADTAAVVADNVAAQKV